MEKMKYGWHCEPLYLWLGMFKKAYQHQEMYLDKRGKINEKNTTYHKIKLVVTIILI